MENILSITEQTQDTYKITVEARIVFSKCRNALITNWLNSFEHNQCNMEYWAQRIKTCNDAELYFVGCLL